MEVKIMLGFNNFMFNSFGGWENAANVYEESDSYVIEVRATGLDKGDISITYGNGGETIRIKSNSNNETEKKSWSRHEFWNDRIDKEYILPEGVDIESVTAKLDKGILTITLPKKKRGDEKLLKKVIEIQ